MNIDPDLLKVIITIITTAFIHTMILVWKLSDLTSQLKAINNHLFNGLSHDVEDLQHRMTRIETKCVYFHGESKDA